MNKLPNNAKEIPNFSGYYATPEGDIWSGPKKTRRGYRQLQLHVNRSGYLYVNLTVNKKEKFVRVHRLILLTFVGPCPDDMQGCHRNDIKIDNSLENLRWDTASNNVKDAIINGRRGRGEKNTNAKLNSWQVRIVRRLLEFGELKQREIAALFNISCSNISDIKNRRSWIHIGD